MSASSGGVQKLSLSVEKTLHLLRSQPSLEILQESVACLLLFSVDKDGFSILVPSPKTAELCSVLVNETIPNFWRLLEPQDKEHLSKCLRSFSGIGALTARLGDLSAQVKRQRPHENTSGRKEHVDDCLEALEQIIHSDELCFFINTNITRLVSNEKQRVLIWKEFVSLIASGKLVSVSARAKDTLKSAGIEKKSFWVTDGRSYGKWLGRNIALMSKKQDEERTSLAALTQLCSKSLSLGYTDQIVWEVLNSDFKHGNSMSDTAQILSHLKPHDRRKFMKSILDLITAKISETIPDTEALNYAQQSTEISGFAALIQSICLGSSAVGYVSDLLIDLSGGFYGLPFFTIRALISSVSSNQDQLTAVLEKQLERFGDSTFVKHSPLLHQNALAASLLTICGYVSRTQPMYLFTLARSSIHMNSVSKRIAASSHKTRFLGMAVGMAISELVEKPEMRLNFTLEEGDQSAYQKLRQLTQTCDKVGSVTDLANLFTAKPDFYKRNTSSKHAGFTHINQEPHPKNLSYNLKTSTKKQGKLNVVEVIDEPCGDDELIPYGKPDLDPEDDDDDPTLINRDKPKPPVYIRDLLVGLKESENYDRHYISLSTAASLIRRKSTFGKEVQDHIEDLLSTIVGLNDAFEFENFQELHQEVMIALVVANPLKVGQILSRTYFTGEYSISQRLMMLTAIGLAARELAGLEVSEEKSGASGSFPSQVLPENLLKIYGEGPSAMGKISRRLEQEMIEPLALEAADKLSGPNILKVRTFSSRMEVEKRRKKPIANELSKIVANAFFFPLAGGWWTHSHMFGTSSLHNGPYLLPTYLHTLSLTLHAAGPSTASLPQMTAEFWDLLLALRTQAVQELNILEAVLFSLLTLLEMNDDKARITQDQSRELLETQRWVKEVFDALGGGIAKPDSQDEGERVKMLAASVLLKCGEIIENHQRMLMGDMIDGNFG